MRQLGPVLSDDAVLWRAVTAGAAALNISAAPAGGSRALRLDYDFHGGAGFVVARCEFDSPLPPAFAVRLRLRGSGTPNRLEIKLLAPQNRQVRRHTLDGIPASNRWRQITIAGEDIGFAWGESGDVALDAIAAVELAIVADGDDGGSGRLWIADLSIVECPPPPAPLIHASSEASPGSAAQALSAAGWQPAAEDAAPWIEIDFQRPRRIGGLRIVWADGAPPSGYTLRSATGARRWRRAYSTRAAAGGISHVMLSGAPLRRLRLDSSAPIAGARCELLPVSAAAAPEACWQEIAAACPRGWHPRWLHREQTLWTAVGNDSGAPHALINADGMVEIAPGGFSLEPMLWTGGRLWTWAEVEPECALPRNWEPSPEVHWSQSTWSLRIQATATAQGRLRLHYTLRNSGAEPLHARLLILVRPFQVSPPWQRYGDIGGLSPITALHGRGRSLRVNDQAVVRALDATPAFGVLPYALGAPGEWLQRGALPPARRCRDRSGWAQGVLAFDLTLAPGEERRLRLSAAPTADQLAGSREADFDWNALLGQGRWRGAGWAMDAIHAARSAAAQVLMTRDGAALQPGPRRYRRSWIRDGAVMAAALLRMGCVAPVAAFIDWYAGYVRPDGYVPCCVDAQGPDPIVEHDSHGQWLALLADYFRHSGDGARIDALWPQIERTVGCLDRLRDATGLLPISASHEGYLAQPVHAYWDDFWALRGLRDIAALASQRGRHEQAAAWMQVHQQLREALLASIENLCRERALDFIPGSLEWADFDPTATAVAINLLDVPPGLDRARLEHTFTRFLHDWRERVDNRRDWRNYTPYEIRSIGALMRLGWREPALELLRFSLDDRRPPAWNQWPEIAWHNTRAPAHVGDLPHTWIAAEYVLAVRSLFACESAAHDALILGAGLAPEWLDEDGVALSGWITALGTLEYRLRRIAPGVLEFALLTQHPVPVVLRPPLPGPITAVTGADAARIAFDATSLTVAPGDAPQLHIHHDRA